MKPGSTVNGLAVGVLAPEAWYSARFAFFSESINAEVKAGEVLSSSVYLDRIESISVERVCYPSGQTVFEVGDESVQIEKVSGVRVKPNVLALKRVRRAAS